MACFKNKHTQDYGKENKIPFDKRNAGISWHQLDEINSTVIKVTDIEVGSFKDDNKYCIQNHISKEDNPTIFH